MQTCRMKQIHSVQYCLGNSEQSTQVSKVSFQLCLNIVCKQRLNNLSCTLCRVLVGAVYKRTIIPELHFFNNCFYDEFSTRKSSNCYNAHNYPEHKQSWYGRLPATPLLLQCFSLSLRTTLTEVSWPIIPVRVGSLQFRTITGESKILL